MIFKYDKSRTVSDLQYNTNNLFYNYEPMADLMQGVCKSVTTDWYSDDNKLNEQGIVTLINLSQS